MKLRDLKRMIEEIPLKSLQYLNIIGKKDQTDKLYQVLRKGEARNDKQTAEILFPGDRNGVAYLLRLKKNLFTRLSNTFLVIHTDHFKDYQRPLAECYKGLAAFRVVRILGMMKIAESIGEDVLKNAIKHHVSDVALGVAKGLLLHYTFPAFFNEERSKELRWQVEHYQSILSKESQIELLFNRMFIVLNRTNAYTEVDEEEIKAILTDLRKITQRDLSYRCILYATQTESFCLGFLKRYVEQVKVCENGIQKIEALPFDSPRIARVSMRSMTIIGLIYSRQFEEAKQAIDYCKSQLTAKHKNYYEFARYEVINFFHEGRYQKAQEILTGLKGKEEYWKLYRAYAAILTGKKLFLGKFLNEIPEYSKDKQGMNINTYIIQVMELIRSDRRDKIIDRIDAVNVYATRHLKSTRRSFLFFQMLVQMVKSGFELLKVKITTKGYLEELQQFPLSESTQDFEVEVVPYELLWNWILERLK